MPNNSVNTIKNKLIDEKGYIAEWWPIVLGLIVLYVPTFYDLANGLWNKEEQAHGPIVLMVVIYLFWQKKDIFLKAAFSTNPVRGWISLILGLLLYIVGRSQDIAIFEIASLIPVVAGVIWCTRGRMAVRELWFPVLFMVFMIPLPAQVVDAVTGPLKQIISQIAEVLLYQLGYPIARSGVVLSVGPYQLLVADACSGLHSMFSLSALGILYLYLMNHSSKWRNGLIIASILPIAFVANVIRVIVIILVTYHFGDEAGQGFIHGFAGIFLFFVALSFLFLIDRFLGKLRLLRDASI